MVLTGLRLMLGTQRGLAVFVGSGLVTFGLLGGLVQLYAALWPRNQINPQITIVVIGVLILAVATFRAWPRRRVQRAFAVPDISVTVEVGNLFDQPGHLVIGFSDTFDTDQAAARIISPNSVQGQFLTQVYGGERDRLDRELDRALADAETIGEESPDDKEGKTRRYPIGTVATLGLPARRYFCVAYAYMQNSLVVKSSVDDLWRSLNQVWDAVRQFGQRGPVAIPVIGSDLARVTSLDRESLLKMMILSFVAAARQQDVCRELVVVVYNNDHDKINMLEVRAFLQAL